jgi:hypothetical protein
MKWLGNLAARLGVGLAVKHGPTVAVTLAAALVAGLVTLGVLDRAQIMAFCVSLSNNLPPVELPVSE